MIKVLFVCHGNICRSPMAEYMFKNLIREKGVAEQFYVESAATSYEEQGNPMYPPARRKLASVGIDTSGHRARRMEKEDYDRFDYILCAEDFNIRNLQRIIGADPKKKVKRILDFSTRPRNISDPWYTGDFDLAYNDILEGITTFLESIGGH